MGQKCGAHSGPGFLKRFRGTGIFLDTQQLLWSSSELKNKENFSQKYEMCVRMQKTSKRQEKRRNLAKSFFSRSILDENRVLLAARGSTCNRSKFHPPQSAYLVNACARVASLPDGVTLLTCSWIYVRKCVLSKAAFLVTRQVTMGRFGQFPPILKTYKT